MNNTISPPPFATYSQSHAWYLKADLAPFHPASPASFPADQTAELSESESQYYHFYQDLIADLYASPQAYGIPEIAYEHLQDLEDSAAQERARESILKVRKILSVCVLDFLFQFGQLAVLEDAALRLDRPRYNLLVMEKSKRQKTLDFLKAYERTGLRFQVDPQTVRLSNERYPEMMRALSLLAKACAPIKDYDSYFFRRADFAVLQGKLQPALDDVLPLVPEPLRLEFLATDQFLSDLKFKCQIFSADILSGYRLRYQRKNVVYWCRVRTQFNPDFLQNLRWDMGSEHTSQLFARLDQTDPGLAERVFNGVRRCQHHYPECGARAVIAYRGQSVEVCNESGWDAIGNTSADFQDLRKVLQAHFPSAG